MAVTAGALPYPGGPELDDGRVPARPPGPAARPSDTGKPVTRRCGAVKADGRPCRGLAQADATTCLFHDTTRADKAMAARRLGGLHRRRARPADPGIEFTGLGDVDAIRGILELAIADVLSLEASTERARVLISAAGAAMRLLEMTVIDARFARLEAAYAAAGLVIPDMPRTADEAAADLQELDE